MPNEKMRLVYADEVKEYLKDKAESLRLCGGNFEAVNQIYMDINSIDLVPTADAVPVVRGRRTAENRQTLIPVEYDGGGNPVLHDCVVYHCDQCGRTAGKKEPYCHCGAKMDQE